MLRFTWPQHGEASTLYGSHIVYKPQGPVHWSNPYLPSASMLVSWSSWRPDGYKAPNPVLGSFVPNRAYQVHFNLTTQPKDGVYAYMTWLDSLGNQVLQHLLSPGIISVPANAAYYRIELYSKGVMEMDFVDLTFEPIGTRPIFLLAHGPWLDPLDESEGWIGWEDVDEARSLGGLIIDTRDFPSGEFAIGFSELCGQASLDDWFQDSILPRKLFKRLVYQKIMTLLESRNHEA